MVAHKILNKKVDRQSNGRFVSGHGGGPGRPKGSKNRFTHVKDYFVEALDTLGGVDYLIRFGQEHPRDFVTLLAKMLPKQIEGTIQSCYLTGEDIDRIKERARRARLVHPPEAAQNQVEPGQHKG